MRHHALPQFWDRYHRLPQSVQRLADKNFELLKADSHHSSLRLKKIREGLWSVRVGASYRALARNQPDGLHWFWIGTHSEYDKFLRE